MLSRAPAAVAVVLSAMLALLCLYSVCSAALTGDGCCRGDPVPPGLLWDSDMTIGENITVAVDEELVISPGVNVTLGRDVLVKVRGSLVCGSPEGPDVIIESREDRLSGGFVLIGSHSALFHNTEFRGLAVAVESIYSYTEFDGCGFNDTGNGLLSIESTVRMEGCEFRYCDMAARLVRSDVEIMNTTFADCIQSVVAHTDISRIGTYWRNEIKPLDLLPSDDPTQHRLTASGCDFLRTGIGLSSFDMPELRIADPLFSDCKKGLDTVNCTGGATGCAFSGNKVDYEMTGEGVSIERNATAPVNYTVFALYRLRLLDLDGKGIPGARLTITHPEQGNASYFTDEKGWAGNISVLVLRARSGVEENFRGYRVVTDPDDLEGYYVLGDRKEVELSPGDLSGTEGEDEKTTSVDWNVCLGILGILLVLCIVGFIRKQSRNGDAQ